MSVTVRGPVFAPGAAAKVAVCARRIIEKLIQMGGQHLSEVLRPLPAGVYLSVAEAGRRASKGDYARHVHGEMTSSSLGIIHDSKCVYGPWLEGTSKRNQTTRFKGYSSFRLTAQWLNKQAPDIVREQAAKLMAEFS